MDIKKFKHKESKQFPPKTVRYCHYCFKKTKWIYNPLVGHSQCSECGLRKVPSLKNLVNYKGNIMEKESKDTQKHNKRRQQSSFLLKLMNKRIRCTLSNSNTLEGTLAGISQYEIILIIDNEENIIFKHALMIIKEIKNGKV